MGSSLARYILSRASAVWVRSLQTVLRGKAIVDFGRERFYDYYARHLLNRRILNNGALTELTKRLMRFWRIKVLFNVVPGLGHNTVELDLFFRMRALGLTGDSERIALVRRPNAIHNDTLSLYRQRFWLATKSHLIFDLLIPAAASAKDLRIDCGLSRLKWHYEPERPLAIPVGGQSYLHQVSKAENRVAWMRYYDIRRKTADLNPLKDGIGIDRPLRKFLRDLKSPVALVHIKYHVANATAAPTDPAAYVPAIEWLKDQGYLVVQVGREAMPDIFKRLGVLDYAKSEIASYRHDLQIFAHATVAVTAGSGIAMIADCMGTPLVYLDSWHIGMPMASPRCVMVPALIGERTSERILSFREELDLYFALEDSGAEIFPACRYSARNAAPDEVLAAVKEVLAFNGGAMELSPLQRKYRDLDAHGLGACTQARASEFFLRRHAGLLTQ
jgi:putative glycosyltransferase (TIGR04372 family)